MFHKTSRYHTSAFAVPLSLVVGLSAGKGMAAAHEEEKFLSNPAGEGVKTNYGECWNAKGGSMDPTGSMGCVEVMAELDSDGDGVPDSRDKCPNTPQGVGVDADGCPVDSDGDGVPDYLDQCPGTRPGAKVDAKGCEIIDSLTINVTADHFDFDSAVLKRKMMEDLDDVAARVKASKGDEMLEIVGHTDSTGPEAYNLGLSERRAQAAANYLEGKGVSMSRITVKGMGESAPVASNATREGRAMNRRVEINTK
mgnify:CR=1 FL=1